MPILAEALDILEQHYGPQHPTFPTDPYDFLIWWHCGYPASDDARTRAFLLLKHHGETLCKRTKPKCPACPLQPTCACAQGHTRGRHTSP